MTLRPRSEWHEDMGAVLRWGSTLAHNLAIGGALCEAFSVGFDQAGLAMSFHDHGYRMESMWRPGCHVTLIE